MVATVTLKIHKKRDRLTFEAFLINDNGVVLWSLCQTEELASERKKEDDETVGTEYEEKVQKLTSGLISLLDSTVTATSSSPAP